ncbi:MAG: trypsin-like serine protease, partial [Deinococcota bacterium]
ASVVRNAMNTGWLQAGITSHGFDCGAPGVPGVYARVDNLADWIFDNATELVSSQTVDFTVTPMPVVNFANALTTTPYVDAGDAFFLKDFDIAPTEIRNASIGQDITFSWEITNTNANSVCTVDVGVDGAATLTVDPCVPGKNSVTFTGGYAEAGQFNAVLTVEAANKTRERSLFITVAE